MNLTKSQYVIIAIAGLVWFPLYLWLFGFNWFITWLCLFALIVGGSGYFWGLKND
jgi:hypothetical protein